MKIGIFGDSYADRHPHGNGQAWFEMLRDRFNLDVTCFGRKGSSLYYSYKKFIDHYEQFDKIIFLVTGPSRLTLPIPQEYDNENDTLRHVTNYNSFYHNVTSNFRNDRYLQQVSKALKLYYAYLMDAEKDFLFHRLLIEEIQRVRPDGLYIPCFNNLGFSSKKTLFDIHCIDVAHYKLSDHEACHREIRHCHFNQENNKILSDLVKHWIDTNDFDLDRDFGLFTRSTMPVEYYFHQGPIPKES